MRRSKEMILRRHKEAGLPSDCMCLNLLELKRGRLFRDYEDLCFRLKRAKTNGQKFNRLLARVMKTGNKLKAIKEAIDEIREAYKIAEAMIEVQINGRSFARLSAYSDYRNSCLRKTVYTEQAASEAATEISLRLGDNIQSYKCRHDDHWHVGHAPEFVN